MYCTVIMYSTVVQNNMCKLDTMAHGLIRTVKINVIKKK